MSAQRLSVIVPTYNRRARLSRVLGALQGQTVSPEIFEVVVVDDGSRDDTVSWLESQSFPFELKVHSQSNAGPAAARNAGVRAARNEFLLFLDDDVVPVPELVEEHFRIHDQSSSDVVVLGTLSSLSTYEQPWIVWEQVQVEKQYAAMQRGEYEPTFRQFWTGNASVRREPVIKAGLFDVTWLRGEDVELGWRLAEQGVGFRFNPRARGLHHAERSLSSFCLAHSSYGRLEVELFSRASPDSVVSILSENLGRLHPAQRRLIVEALERPRWRQAFKRRLCQFLESSIARQAPRVARPACSLLANLLYWEASAEALGPTSFALVRKQALA